MYFLKRVVRINGIARLTQKKGTKMIKTLAKSIREYKTPSIVTPILVAGEVVLECIIPFITAKLITEIKNGCDLRSKVGGNHLFRYLFCIRFSDITRDTCLRKGLSLYHLFQGREQSALRKR